MHAVKRDEVGCRAVVSMKGGEAGCGLAKYSYVIAVKCSGVQ